MNNLENNNGAQITVLKYPENVRQRVGMYLSSKEHAIFEIIDNSIDEFLAGYAKNIRLILFSDNVIQIQDDGRGIPVEPHKDPEYNGLSQVEVAATVLHAGGKFDGVEDSYKTVTAGLNGVGLSCVNATSSQMQIDIYKNNCIYTANFEKGYITQNLRKIALDPNSHIKNGTVVTFILDEEIWGDISNLDIHKIKVRMQQLAFLNPGLTLEFCQANEDGTGCNEIKYYYPDGVNAYIKKIVGVKPQIIDNIIAKNGTMEDVEMHIALMYTDSYSSDVLTFCNNINTEDGGDHLIGFRQGALKAINEYAINNKFIKDTDKFEAPDILEGMSAIVSIKVKEPRFISQAKNKIDMRYVRSIVSSFTENMISLYFDKNPDDAKAIINKCISAYKTRKYVQKARENMRKNKELFEGSMAGKIADCQSKKAEECELFIVEGNSAGGTAKNARDRRTQAILPIFGKILNVEKTGMDKVIVNDKLLDVLRALKCGIGEDFDISKLRYNKIVLASDADKPLTMSA